MQALLDLGEDFTVIFCGGSFISSVLCCCVRESFKNWSLITVNNSMVVWHYFLSNVNTTVTTAMACRAALSAIYVPPFAEGIEGAAMGN